MASDIRWKYIAETATGKVVKGVIIASDQASAVQLIKAGQLTPVTLQKIGGSHAPHALTFLTTNKQLSLFDLVEFCRGFSDLLNAGVPVGKALDLLESEITRKTLRPFMTELANAVRTGKSLSEALDASAVETPRLVTAMAMAGENTGKLASQFTMLADHYEAQFKLRRELTAQTIYPCALLVLIVLTIIFLSNFVLPQFETIFSNADALPPPETRIVMAIGEWIRSNALLFPLGVLGSLILGKIALSQRRTLCEKALLRTPYLGSLWHKIIAGRCCRSIGALLVGGASMSTALNIGRQTIPFEVITLLYDEASKNIRSGTTFADAIAQSAIFPDIVVSFAKLGEETGMLGPMLLKAGDRCEQDIKANLTKLTRLIGPLMTAIMGLLTAGVIAAVMSGVLSLNETVY